jgi:hypothetical protein
MTEQTNTEWASASDELRLSPGDGGESIMFVYEIRIQGHLDQRWSAWFDGLTINYESDGSTLLQGPLVDEAALHGVLIKVRDLALPLLAMNRITDSRVEMETQAPIKKR